MVIFASQVSDSLTLISPLADLVATELPSNGQCELSLLTETLSSEQWYGVFFYLGVHTCCELISPLSFRRKLRVKTCLSDLNDSTLAFMSCSIFPNWFSLFQHIPQIHCPLSSFGCDTKSIIFSNWSKTPNLSPKIVRLCFMGEKQWQSRLRY